MNGNIDELSTGAPTGAVAAEATDVNTPAAAFAESAPRCTARIEGEFVKRLDQVLGRLRQHRIPFCVLRNVDRIPRGLLQGSDVDVIVPAGTKPRDLMLIMRDLHPLHVVAHYGTLEAYFSVGPLLLHVDFLIADRQWRGARYLTNRAILDAAVDENGIPAASPVHQAFCAWFSSLTRRRLFKARYINLITSAVRSNPLEMRALLDEAFGRRLSAELLGLVERGELERSVEFAGRCRRSVWLRALRRRPLGTLGGLFGYYVPEVRLWARPPGLAVAVLGPDGSGKSAVCDALAGASRAVLPFGKVTVQHLYERFLPRLSELKHGRLRRTPATPATVHDPHGKPPHSLPGSLVALGYTSVDQWLSRLCVGRRKLGRNVLLLHDRCMCELSVDPRRFRYGGPSWLAAVFARLTPPLDLVVLLDAPPEVLQRRKQEVPFEETKRQREAYRAMVSQMPNGRIIDADRPLEQVIEDVRRAVLRCLADRCARRFQRLPATAPTDGATAPFTLGSDREGLPQ